MSKLTKKQEIELFGKYNEMKENGVSFSRIAEKTNTSIEKVIDFFNR